jgi:hypothetical protein
VNPVDQSVGRLQQALVDVLVAEGIVNQDWSRDRERAAIFGCHGVLRLERH